MSFQPDQTSILKALQNGQHSLDQLLNNSVSLEPHWNTFFKSFAQLGDEEIVNRSQDMSRFLKENGVTYNIYGDPSGMNRTWKLDIIPYLVSAEEWAVTEAGLVQRATLFNLLLKDIYGEQRLMKEGLLPMEIIYNHPGFIRECFGIKLTGQHLVVYSADLARNEKGVTWVLNDRTQAPSGSGYALENRLAMARIVPELFNGLRVKKLSPHYNTFRNALVDLAPQRKNDPRIVILTPGPGNETYFEHSFLSSHLGFTLVQGDDLMVKDNIVWLKTLGGLEKVDVILRRVDDEYCDPLELKDESQLGVPGLLQAVRSGNVSIANPLGSSVVENPGLLPFLPTISRFFLGEELKLPTIASWWCGQPKEMNYVLENISSLVVKRIYRDSTARTSVDATSLSRPELDDLKRRIKAHPYLYVGQEKINFSPTPSMINSTLQPCNALFRSYAVSDNGSYSVMAGGLTRTSVDKDDIIISNQLGGYSKDTWVLSNEESTETTFKKEQDYIQKNPSIYRSDVLPSRTAENFFWVGRYAERVLGNARFHRTVMQFVDEANRAFLDNDPLLTNSLLYALMAYTHSYPDIEEKEREDKLREPWKLLAEILLEENRMGSLSYNITSFSRAVLAVRDHWSTDTWRVLREMEDEWKIASELKGSGHYKLLGKVDKLITSMMAFVSLNRESISREQGWILLDAGRKTEQSLLLISMLQSTLVFKQDEQIEYIMQEAVLKSNESLVNYRYKYRSHIQLNLVLDLMLLDPNNPRSLVYQLERLKAYLEMLPKKMNGHLLSEQERLALEAFTILKLADSNELAQHDVETGMYTNLNNFLSKMNELLLGISNAVSKMYFKHAQQQQQLFRS